MVESTVHVMALSLLCLFSSFFDAFLLSFSLLSCLVNCSPISDASLVCYFSWQWSALSQNTILH